MASLAASACGRAVGSECEEAREEDEEETPADRAAAARWIEHPQVLGADAEASPHPDIVAAVRTGQIQPVLRQLQVLPSIDEPLTRSGATALAISCSVGHVYLTSVLMKNGADPAKVDLDGLTCLHRACAEGHLKVVRRLRSLKKVDPGAFDLHGRTPMHLAVLFGKLDVVRFLLSTRVNPNIQTAPPGEGPRHQSREETPLLFAVRRLSKPTKVIGKPPRYQAMELLLEYDADPLISDSTGDTPLHVCARQGDLPGLFLLLAGVPDVRAALDLKNCRGDSVVDEADLTAVSHGVAVRAAMVMPQAMRAWVLSILFSEPVAIFRAG